MKAALLSSLVELDIFGSPIKLNYKGKETYQTRLGTLFTISLATFILIFGLYSLIDIYEYRDPQITQFTIYDKRQNEAEINFGEAFGSIAFGFQNPKNLSFIELDPRYGTLTLDTTSRNMLQRKMVTVQELEMININLIDHPGYFSETYTPEE